jgi:ferric-dicitrate binding protein FerR (iron transport regulator)
MAGSLDELLTNGSFRRFVLNPTQDEDNTWERWINESAVNRELYEEASEILRDFYEPLSPDEFQSEAIKFKRSIDVTRADKNDINNLYENRRPYGIPKIYRIAAALLLFASALFVVSWYFYGNNVLDGAVTDASGKIVRKAVGRGQKLTVTFQDGTKVKLNSESTLTYPEEFSHDVREVTLVGEAYFEVAHNEQWPFVVSTEKAQIQVLGTSFNVNAQDKDSDVMVALVDGSVRISSDMEDSSPVYLKPLEMAVIDGAHQVSVKDFDLEKVTAWKDNKIIFERASFDEVESVLARWFNVTFHYDQKPVFTGGYTGEFIDQSLGNILEGMSTGKFVYEIRGNSVYIN